MNGTLTRAVTFQYYWSLCLNSMEFAILKMIGRACQTLLSDENYKIGYIKEHIVSIAIGLMGASYRSPTVAP